MPEARPPAFTYRLEAKGSGPRQLELHCDEVPISRLAKKYGTPLYLYSASTIRERVRLFDRAFRKIEHTICYSVKANSNLSLLRLLHQMGCGFDVVSGGELLRVQTIGAKAAKGTVFSGVGKTRAELRDALRAGILLFNLESESELEALTESAAQLRRKARVALRVNPDVEAKTHPYISTGLQQHKFGVPIDEARNLYRRVARERFLEVAGVSVHIGSQITDIAPFAATAERVADLVRELRGDGHDIGFVDVGGGLGIDYDRADHELASFKKQISRYAEGLLERFSALKVHLLLEPGRSVVGPAGSLVTSVVYRKTNGKKRFVIVDAAMNDLIRPALYNASHQIVPVQPATAATTEKVDVVGPICETGDFFARDRELPLVKEGDLLAILDAGAYGMALASNYNSRPRPAEILIDGKAVKLIRRRETMRDLLARER
jgi:diaminopimelate decarboxylase